MRMDSQHVLALHTLQQITHSTCAQKGSHMLLTYPLTSLARVFIHLCARTHIASKLLGLLNIADAHDFHKAHMTDKCVLVRPPTRKFPPPESTWRTVLCTHLQLCPVHTWIQGRNTSQPLHSVLQGPQGGNSQISPNLLESLTQTHAHFHPRKSFIHLPAERENKETFAYLRKTTML